LVFCLRVSLTVGLFQLMKRKGMPPLSADALSRLVSATQPVSAAALIEKLFRWGAPGEESAAHNARARAATRFLVDEV
jgi:hypothetical protein